MESFLPVRGTDVGHHVGGAAQTDLLVGRSTPQSPGTSLPPSLSCSSRKKKSCSCPEEVFFLPLPVYDGCLEDKFRPQQGRGTGAEVLSRRVLEAMQGFLGKGGFPLDGAATVWSAVVVTGSRVLF